MNKNLISQTLSNFFMFKELASEQIETIALHSQLIQFPKGTSVFNRGDAAVGLYILLDGQLKLGVTSPQGSEKIISIVTPGESFGEAILFLERQFPVYAQATLDSDVLLVPKSLIFSMLDNDPLFSRKMLAGLSIRMHQLVQDIEMLSLQSCTQRFIGYLLQISADAPDASNITLPASKSTIASLLNLTPETLSRTLAKLQQLGLIAVNGKDVMITDVKKLHSYELSI
ncbi:MAG: Crp/Fnr family transcriptional regulator [Methylotenera sp.]|jgi:CRP-like cAMP-binding protein|uniref:Crp/Fnr family transcriptional regulator n=1 Tax=Methylotenera mobilis TaxID=359408 RepID=UPI000365B85E|nr:Crp/Fnr family transcriptional regulator [Methylotenera mobilis]PPC98183.1 MAG: Crp/Fnr family transcriptional regulator [Methylotenera sp.]